MPLLAIPQARTVERYVDATPCHEIQGGTLMLKSRVQRFAGLAVGALLALALVGCVQAKPEREREPLPTLPVESVEETALLEAEGEEIEVAEGSEAAEAALGEEEPAAEAQTEEVAEGQEGAAEAEQPEEVAPVEEAATEPPAPTPQPELPPYDGPLYVVQEGDTLASIAMMHASTVTAFMEVNGMSDSAAISVGQELRLPPGAVRYDPEQLSTYIVRPGDTLSHIAAWHRMPIEQLQALNPALSSSGVLRIGDKLTVLIQPIPEGATVHVVQAGESLASIAALYGVSLVDLAQANYISDANRLDVGQQLVIPQ